MPTFTYLYLETSILRVCKPAYSELVPKPKIMRVAAGRTSGIKVPCGAWLDLLSSVWLLQAC